MNMTQTYKSKKKIASMAWTIAMSLFHFGYFVLYITQIPIGTLKEIYNIELQDGLTDGLLNGCIPIGGLFGALGSTFFISRYSRRKSLMVTNALAFIVGCLIFIQSFPMLIVCRFLQGFCVGMFTSIAPLMVSQISPIQISGALGSYTQINVCLGIFFGCFAPYLLLKMTGDLSGRSYWFLVFGIPQIVIVIQVCLLAFVFPYETPKYLLQIGNEEQAKKLIEIIYLAQYVQQILESKKNDVENERNMLKMNKIGAERFQQSLIDQETSNNISNNQIVPFLVTLHLSALQQLSGINVVSVYAEALSNQIASGELALILPSIINFLEVLATLASFFVLSRVGRRTILLYGTIGVTIANALIMVGYFSKDNTSYGLSILLFGILAFILSFGLSLGPVVWLYIPQVVSPKKVPYSTAVNWISASCVIILFPILTEDYLGNNPAILFIFSTVWGLISIIINYFFVLQTKDKTENKIKEDYANLRVCRK